MPTRVLMTADAVGGVWTYAVELAAALQPFNVALGLATMGRRLDSNQRRQLQLLPNVEVFESEYKLEWMDDPWEDVSAAGRWLLSLQEKFHPDLIHLNNYCHAALPWRVPAIVVAHSCVLSWWRAVHGHDAPPSWDRYRQAVRAGLQSSDLVVAPSRAMLSMLEEHYGHIGTCQVIPGGRPLPCGLSKSKQPIILTAGRLSDAAKNVSALAAVAPELPWPVFVAGEEKPAGASSAALESNSHAADLPVTYLGDLSRDAMSAWFERASIFALPARYEPFGFSVLEAALSGCALVLGDIPSLRELWDGAAVFISPESHEDLREALQELILSPTWRSRLRLDALNRARRYNPEVMAAGYLKAYSQVCQPRRGVARPPDKTIALASIDGAESLPAQRLPEVLSETSTGSLSFPNAA